VSIRLPVRQVIGSSKTFKQLARLSGAPPQRRGPFVRRSLTRKDVPHWMRRLAALSSQDRAGLCGISQYRASQVLAGAVVAHATMTALNIKALERMVVRSGEEWVQSLSAVKPEP